MRKWAATARGSSRFYIATQRPAPPRRARRRRAAAFSPRRLPCYTPRSARRRLGATSILSSTSVRATARLTVVSRVCCFCFRLIDDITSLFPLFLEVDAAPPAWCSVGSLVSLDFAVRLSGVERHGRALSVREESEAAAVPVLCQLASDDGTQLCWMISGWQCRWRDLKVCARPRRGATRPASSHLRPPRHSPSPHLSLTSWSWLRLASGRSFALKRSPCCRVTCHCPD